MDLITVRSARTAMTRDDLRLAPGEVAIGGGTWLYSEEQHGISGVVDLMGMGWTPVERTEDSIVVAATCSVETLRRLTNSPLFLQCADSLLASWKIQHVATVGGNIATSLPAGPMTSLATALDATVVLWTATEERRMSAVDFVTGVRTNALLPGEVLRAIEFPLHAVHARSGFRRIALSPLGRTGTLVIGRRDASGLVVFAVSGGTTRPHRLAFDGVPGPAELDEAIDAIDDWYADPHGAADWRRAMSALFAHEIREELE